MQRVLKAEERTGWTASKGTTLTLTQPPPQKMAVDTLETRWLHCQVPKLAGAMALPDSNTRLIDESCKTLDHSTGHRGFPGWQAELSATDEGAHYPCPRFEVA